MSRSLWILFGILGAAMVLLIANHDNGVVAGIPNERMASVIYLLCLLAFIGGGIFSSGQMRQNLSQLAVWAGIFLVVTTGYLYRYEAHDAAYSLTGGLVPPSPLSGDLDGQRNVYEMRRGRDGHYTAEGVINGTKTSFLVDTGASSVVLSWDSAAAVGIDVDNLAFVVPMNTANGRTMSAIARVDLLEVGGISRRDFKVLVSQEGALDANLLGMDFLSTLASYEVRGDRMFMRD